MDPEFEDHELELFKIVRFDKVGRWRTEILSRCLSEQWSQKEPAGKRRTWKWAHSAAAEHQTRTCAESCCGPREPRDDGCEAGGVCQRNAVITKDGGQLSDVQARLGKARQSIQLSEVTAQPKERQSQPRQLSTCLTTQTRTRGHCQSRHAEPGPSSPNCSIMELSPPDHFG